jgi:hypothetical protein
MADIYLIPKWFSGYDVAIEISFAIITLFVSIYAFKIYKLSGSKQSKLFGTSFGLISLSYFSWALLNFAILEELNEGITYLSEFRYLSILHSTGLFLHIALFLAGLVTLAYMTFKISSPKTYILLMSLTFVGIIMTPLKFDTFFLISTILVLFVFIFYLTIYFQNKNPNNLLVMLAFLFLLIGSLHFNFSIHSDVFYVLGHIFELIGYLLITINLALVLKK